MKLLEALEILRSPTASDAPRLNVYLGCGFTPIYLETYLRAHLKQRLPDHVSEVKSGLFGDLAGNLERLVESNEIAGLHACVVVIEWPDLDERLGFRTTAGWRPENLPDVIANVHWSLDRIAKAVDRIGDRIPVVCSTPSLMAAPLSFAPPEQGDAMFWTVEAALSKCALRLAGNERIRIVNPRCLDSVSPPAGRADVKSTLAAGYPYTLEHTDVLAQALASFIVPRQALKGLITDLDDTLWLGILGEAGVDGVQWTLECQAQIHGVFQQFLQSLADAGILIGVASRNDPELARQVFERRKDLLVKAGSLFPREVNWGAKSHSVTRILRAWNIGADSVAFVDDSPMDVAEVAAEHPDIHGFVFPKDDPAAVVDLLRKLRGLFGKSSISAEDKIRAASLSARETDGCAADSKSASEEFLAAANATVHFDCTNPPQGGRALELINKTNQFNLNGRRYTEAEWQNFLRSAGAFVCVVEYQDRFGPLGRIGVVAGIGKEHALQVTTWVMSCRAFSRRIEHACLRYLFSHAGARQIEFLYAPTPRNGPVRDFLASLLGTAPSGACIVDRDTFDAACPALYHEVVVHAPATEPTASPRE